MSTFGRKRNQFSLLGSLINNVVAFVRIRFIINLYYRRQTPLQIHLLHLTTETLLLLLISESGRVTRFLCIIFLAEEIGGVLILFTSCGSLLQIDIVIDSAKFHFPLNCILFQSFEKFFYSLLLLPRRFYILCNFLNFGLFFLLLNRRCLRNNNLPRFRGLMTHEKVGTSILIVIFTRLINLMDFFFFCQQSFNIVVCLQVFGLYMVEVFLASRNG